MAVDGVPGAEHAAFLQVRRVHLVVAPQARAGDLDVEVGHAEQVADDLGGCLAVDDGRRLADVVAPDDQPLVPWPDHADQTGADAADVAARLDDPVEDGRPGRHVRGNISFEGDIH
jgi:hypothetical protein